MRKFSFSRKSLGVPYALFLLVFVIAPLLVLFYYAFIPIPLVPCATALHWQL